MTTRDDFEKWFVDLEKDAPSLIWQRDFGGQVWQACAAHYEAEQAKDYVEWIDERNALLALIAEKDKALREFFETGFSHDNSEKN